MPIRKFWAELLKMIDMQHYILFWVCIIGLCLGSFYNVVILRSLANESIVFPPSKCPKCGNKLKWWHNIPVLSYILLGGKCYFCKEKISIQYPIIELVTMILFGLSFAKFGFSIKTLFVIFWVSCLIIMTGTDIKKKLVDCNIAIGMGISGIVFNFINGGISGGIDALIGLLIGVVILEAVARSGYIFAGTRAMGEADSYVAGALGAIFGKQIILVLFAALIASMIFILPIFFYNQYKNNNKKVCILSILFTLSILVFETVWQNYYTLAAMVIIGLYLAFSILGSIKNNESSRNYLPYVPALAAGALFFLFF